MSRQIAATIQTRTDHNGDVRVLANTGNTKVLLIICWSVLCTFWASRSSSIVLLPIACGMRPARCADRHPVYPRDI